MIFTISCATSDMYSHLNLTEGANTDIRQQDSNIGLRAKRGQKKMSPTEAALLNFSLFYHFLCRINTCGNLQPAVAVCDMSGAPSRWSPADHIRSPYRDTNRIVT
jgi:hypothetical protein